MLKFFKFSLLVVIFCNLSVQTFAQNQTAQDFFEQGVHLVRERKFEEALAAFRRSAQLDPKQAATQANIGSTLIALNRASEAVAPFREAARLAPNEVSFRIGLCQSLSLAKNHAEAVTQCEEAARLSGNTPAPHGALVAALRTAKRTDDALRAVNLALQKFPEDEMLLNFAAEINVETGNYARATEIYETLARLKPTAVFYQIRLAENYLRLERDAEAIAAARKALEVEQHPLAYFFLGRVYFELGQNEEAAQSFQKSVELDAKNSDGFYFLGLSEARRGKFDTAITALRKAVAIAPESFEYNKELGSALTQNAQYEEAIAPLRKAVALKPKDFEAVVGLGGTLSEAAQLEEGLKYLTLADEIKPGNQIVNMLLNVGRARQQNMGQIERMKSFAKENPQDLNVRLHLVQLLTYGRRASEAAPYIEEVWQMNPKDARVYLMIGTLHSTTGNYEKAAEAYRKTLEIEPNNPGAYAGLANYYARKGQIEEAIKAYEKLFELKPDSPNFMKLYADLLRDNGKRREALGMYKRSLSMLPTNAPALFNAGVLSAKLGDLNAARQYLETLKTVDAQSAKMLARFLKLQR